MRQIVQRKVYLRLFQLRKSLAVGNPLSLWRSQNLRGMLLQAFPELGRESSVTSAGRIFPL